MSDNESMERYVKPNDSLTCYRCHKVVKLHEYGDHYRKEHSPSQTDNGSQAIVIKPGEWASNEDAIAARNVNYV